MSDTPITDAVREHRGDYLAAVEDLEREHAAFRQRLIDAGLEPAPPTLAQSIEDKAITDGILRPDWRGYREH